MVFGSLLLLAFKLVASFLLVCIFYLLVNPIHRLRYRHLPGPSYRPIFGNLPEFRKYGSHDFMVECKKRYGPVFKLWFGHRPWVVVAEPEYGKRVNYKLLNRPRTLGDPVIRGQYAQDKNRGLFFSRDELWRMLHQAWQPAFYPESVHACAPLMSRETQKLAARLEALAAEGKPVDIWREVGNLTMAIVGSSAYGIDFQTIHVPAETAEPQPASAIASTKAAKASWESKIGIKAATVDLDQHDIGSRLVDAAQTMFSAASANSGSIYSILALLAPSVIRPAIVHLAHEWPDAPFKRVLEARAMLAGASLQLIKQTRDKQVEEKQKPGSVAAPAKKHKGAISPGSFLGLLLSAADNAVGQKLSDFALMMQANTFTLAGYETTANALSFCLFCLATHPEYEQKVLQEVQTAAAVDASGQPNYRDLENQYPYTCAVVSEALRLYPPGASTAREVVGQPLQLGQFTVPEGSTVIVATYVMHRDPEIWPRALEFLPERWLPGHEHLAPSTSSAYLPFGSGARACIGSRFALQEVRLGLLELLPRFKFNIVWNLMMPAGIAGGKAGLVSSNASSNGDAGAQKILKTQNNFTLSPAGGIWVKVIPRAAVAS